jgi:hypothetical protein
MLATNQGILRDITSHRIGSQVLHATVLDLIGCPKLGNFNQISDFYQLRNLNKLSDFELKVPRLDRGHWDLPILVDYQRVLSNTVRILRMSSNRETGRITINVLHPLSKYLLSSQLLYAGL